MATYIHQQFGFTIAGGTSLRYWYSWQNIANVGPNHGPVLFTADPRSHQDGATNLVTFDVAKCRNAPTGPAPQNPGTEVFYEFSVRNDAATFTTFDLEVIWGQITNSQAPW
jgi:hypothetical protein